MSLKNLKQNIVTRIPLVASILMLLGASGYYHKYGYYQLLRLLVCGTTIAFAYISYLREKAFWMCTLGIIAFLFNPLIPVHLDRYTWQWIDFIAAIILFAYLIATLLPKGAVKA